MPDCFCCSCDHANETPPKFDPACRNHGAHGKRECIEHKAQPEACGWKDGCGMTLDKVIAGEH